MRYEILDHTADQAIRASGQDLRELIENAAAGMVALLYGGRPPAAEHEVGVSVAAEGAELVLHHALRELLYLLEDEGLAPVTVRVVAADAEGAKLQVGVVPRAQAEPALRALLKAVTRHGLQIQRSEGTSSVTIVFDV
ncbi:archease [bacterium]|nr:archease [bacterium]